MVGLGGGSTQQYTIRNKKSDCQTSLVLTPCCKLITDCVRPGLPVLGGLLLLFYNKGLYR